MAVVVEYLASQRAPDGRRAPRSAALDRSCTDLPLDGLERLVIDDGVMLTGVDLDSASSPLVQ